MSLATLTTPCWWSPWPRTRRQLGMGAVVECLPFHQQTSLQGTSSRGQHFLLEVCSHYAFPSCPSGHVC